MFPLLVGIYTAQHLCPDLPNLACGGLRLALFDKYMDRRLQAA